MLRRRVPVSSLGSRDPGGHQKSFRFCSQSVRECRGVSRTLCSRNWSRNAELSSLFTFRLTQVPTVTGIRGSWSRNAELSSLLNSCLVVASQKCQQSQYVRGIGGVLVAKRRAVVTFGLAFSPFVAKVPTVTGIRRVLVAVVFLDMRLVVASQNCEQSQRSGGGGPGRETQSCQHFWTCV